MSLSFLHRERATAHRTLRRQDKKLKDVVQSVEDERKQAESYKGEVGVALAHILYSSVLHHYYTHIHTSYEHYIIYFGKYDTQISNLHLLWT